MQVLNKIADLLILNLVTFLFCIPIFTIGASMTAMHYVLLKMVRGKDSYIIKDYWKSFKQNFKQATAIWMVLFLIGMTLLVDFKLFASEQSPFPKPVIWMVFAAAIIWLCVFLYVFPVLARFVNTVKGTFKNSLFMSILGLPRTVGMVLATALPTFIFIFAPETAWRFLPLFLCFGITVPGFICAWLYSPLFLRFENQTEEKKEEVELEESEYEEAAAILHDEDEDSEETKDK